ncbi:hypothetical protein [Streptomyces sp. NPDC048187]|uniref:hypothetical protein n=1 Tax=Streptomyces sp. NPDC048187 TaxID=3365509 RepID=UPI003719FCEF
MAYELNSLLGRLVDYRLHAVHFVEDYVELHLEARLADESPVLRHDDRPVLSCYVLPNVTVSGQEFSPADLGWADALRRLIPQDVMATFEETGIGIRVDFANGGIRLNPTEDELVGPEIAMLSGFEDHSWMVWRPGEDAFEDL